MKISFYVQGFESLAAEYLSACLKEAGHETKLFFEPRLYRDGVVNQSFLAGMMNLEDKILEDMLRWRPDLAAFPTVTDNYATALRVAGKLKNLASIPTVFGGIHVTSVPDVVVQESQVDYIVLGEGEYALLDLVKAIERNESDFEIPNVWYMKDGEILRTPVRPTISNLDDLPFPDKDLYYDAVPDHRRQRYLVGASRGCPYTCTYCNNSNVKRLYKGKGKWYRRRSVENLISELSIGLAKYNFKRVYFVDEILVRDIEWLREFADAYSDKIAKPFLCSVHPAHVTQEAVALLEKAGCGEANMGVQTYSEQTRREYLKRHHSNESVINAIELFRKSKVFLSTGNILQLPGQTLEEGLDLVRFYNKHRVDRTIVGFLRYYPRTPIVEIAKNMGILDDKEIKRQEKVAEETPFLKRTKHDLLEFESIRNLILFTTVLPKWMITFLIERDRYKLLPRIEIFNLIDTIVGFVVRVRTGKRRFIQDYTISRYFLESIRYCAIKISWKIRRKFERSNKDPR